LTRTLESDDQREDGTAVVPKVILEETSRPPKRVPNTETKTEPETGTSIGSTIDTIGFENEMWLRETVVRPAREARTRPPNDGPAGDLHNKIVSEIHKVVSQNVPFERSKGDAS
jgi:hypothetical protein